MLKKLIAICLIASCSIAEQITLGIITDLSWNGTMAKWGSAETLAVFNLDSAFSEMGTEGAVSIQYLSKSYAPGSPLAEFPALTNNVPSFKFLGWTDSAFTTPVTTNDLVPSGGLTVYANWEAVAVGGTFYFDIQGGSGTVPDGWDLYPGFTYQQPYLNKYFPADPTKDYYSFKGWYSDSVGWLNEQGFSTAPTNIYTGESITAIYANWGPIEIALDAFTLKPEGAPDSIIRLLTTSPISLSGYQAFGSYFPVCSFESPAYSFSGWYDIATTATYPDNEAIIPAASTTLTATFAETQASTGGLYFNLNDTGAQGETPVIPLYEGYTFGNGHWGDNYQGTGTYNPTNSFPADPTLADTVFMGWNVAGDASGSYVVGMSVYDSATYGLTLTLYGIWGVTMTFDPTGGEVALPTATAESSSQTYRTGVYTGTLPLAYANVPTYSFSGVWIDSSLNTYDGNTFPSFTTVYPVWSGVSPDTTTEFFLQDPSATGDQPSINLYTGWPYGSGDDNGNHFPTDPVLTGSRFNGWFDYTEGGTRIYPSTIYDYATSTRTLYAQWSVILTLTFDLTTGYVDGGNLTIAGASVSPTSIEYCYPDNSSSLPSVTTGVPGWAHEGRWSDGSTDFTNGNPGPSASCTLYPFYVPVGSTGTVTFDLQSGETGETPTIHLYEGWSFGSGPLNGNEWPVDPTYTGYYFGGWYSEAAGGGYGPIDASTIYAAMTHGTTITLNAYWIAN